MALATRTVEPAPLQFPEKMQCLFSPSRYKAFHGGRGSAKSWSVARFLLVRGIQQQTRVLCVREFQNSMDDSVYALLKDQVEMMGLGAYYTVMKTEILGPNGTSFNFEGIKNNPRKIKSYEGTDICWVEEADKITRTSWNILIPTIRKPGSEIIVTFNPDLDTDYLYQFFVKDPPKDAIVQQVNWSDNPWFPDVLRGEMEDLKRRDYDEYLHVWEGKTRVVLAGAVYAEEIRRAMTDGRICKVPWIPALPVDVFFDLGWADMTTMWFRQRVGFEWHYIGYEEARQKPFSYYLKRIQEREYLIGTVWLPHDARAKDKGTGTSVEDLCRKAHPGRTRIVKRLGLEDGINAGRELWPLCYFDETGCAEGITHLQHYRYEVVSESGNLSRIPIHDEHSHGADGFRYSAVATKQPKTERAEAAELKHELNKRKFNMAPDGPGVSTEWMQG